MSKATSDLIHVMKADLARMEKELTGQRRQIADMEDRLNTSHELFGRTDEMYDLLHRKQVGVLSRLNTIEDSEECLWDEFERLKKSVRRRMANQAEVTVPAGVGDEAAPVELQEPQEPPQTMVRKKDTPLQTATRNAIIDMMGIAPKAALPKPLGTSAGVFWLEDNQGKCVLRPTWEIEGENKAGWFREVAEKVKLDGHKWHGKLAVEDLEKTSLAQVEAAVATAWRSMRDRYKAEGKGEAARADDQRLRRHEQRKRAKLSDRKELRDHVEEMQAPKWNWLMSAWKYMSTDETDEPEEDGQGAVDANTSEEAQNTRARVISKSKVWIAHWPSYRPSELERPLRKLDKVIVTHRKENSASGGAQHATRTRGEKRDKPLPNVCKVKGAVKIPRSLVDREWLERHPEQNIPRLMLFDDVGSSADVDVEMEYDGGDEGDVGAADDGAKSERQVPPTRESSSSIDPALSNDVASPSH
ncbi:uncharacterized protein C8Q71DRAFT_855630 [Rhodofomes roseus]|uniref:Uncharacterized protein n=1 Tax=Rhodofomes roseus TaxID=34475 RepID=A0ABQ8KLJ1_9APHY|nr:uncharacterized protein C8Q71DRAFT_855629 [Rhodofomes roseus]XP_047780730.1 uncharacterized protein C8Q71DRAFT_855630 [Rhodofomes roseus]KAH9838973.1 hypothetical protein C8Q71DRAFT_855629 [Rhodofomes roseus]KAH9838975.1 hypothetical protein C8Q71DRAFT_855630 [Rhodofomes roseus]